LIHTHLHAKAAAEPGFILSYTMNKDGIVGQALQRHANELDAQYRKLINERERLIEDISASSLTQSDIDRSLHLRDDIITGIQNPTPEIMLRVIEAIDLRVQVIEGDKVKLFCRLPVQSYVTDLNTPGGAAVNYPRFVPMARDVDLAAILFEHAVRLATVQ
jgi:hypothetical protein